MAMNSWYIHAGIALLRQYYVHVHVYTTLLYMCYSVCTISITFDFVFRCVIGEGIIWKQLHPWLTFIPRLRLTVSSHLYNTRTHRVETQAKILTAVCILSVLVYTILTLTSIWKPYAAYTLQWWNVPLTQVFSGNCYYFPARFNHQCLHVDVYVMCIHVLIIIIMILRPKRIGHLYG